MGWNIQYRKGTDANTDAHTRARPSIQLNFGRIDGPDTSPVFAAWHKDDIRIIQYMLTGALEVHDSCASIMSVRLYFFCVPSA